MIVTCDFETYYDKDYSLSKMSEAEYILDPQFAAIMVAIKHGSNPTVVHVGEENIKSALSKIDWSRTAMLAHNARFDGSILAWRYNHYPRLYLDTLSMARAVTHWQIGSSSLKKVSEYLGLPPKGDEVVRAIGKRLSDFEPDELQSYMRYCARDNDNAWEIFNILRPAFTARELQLIDLILRMFIQPQVLLDERALSEHLDEVRAEKTEIFASIEGKIDKSVFSSNHKFAALLRDHGVDVPMKRSPVTGELIPALARHDWEFKELCADETLPAFVQALLMTRVSVKSTIDETRAEALLRLSRLPGSCAPVPLKFYGARTGRLSGDGGTNWQNFRRGSKLRAGVVAPEGYRIVHRDSSQIEARMAAWLAGCSNLLTSFAAGRDVYCEFAEIVYNREVTKENKLERWVGKTAILGLGYGCGAAKFRHMLYVGSGGLNLRTDQVMAEIIVGAYRKTFPEIVGLWRACDLMLARMVADEPQIERLTKYNGFKYNLWETLERLPLEVFTDALRLPNDLFIYYPELKVDWDDSQERAEMFFKNPYGGKSKIYGAKVTENISQALARIILTDIVLRVYQTTGFFPWLSCHDSISYCVPQELAEEMDQELAREFAIVPPWAEGLPLASEGGWGKTMLDAEMKVNE